MVTGQRLVLEKFEKYSAKKKTEVEFEGKS